MAVANLVLRFILEMIGFLGIGYAAFAQTHGLPAVPQLIVAIAASLLFIAGWWMLVAPSQQNGLSQEQKDFIGTGLLLVVAAAFQWAGQPVLAAGYAVLVIINAALLLIFPQDVRERFSSRS